MARALETKPTEPLIEGHGLIAPPPIHIHSDAFEGTLAMLFRCVKEARVDLMGVPLGPVCEAYFVYVASRPGASLDEAAAALAILSYLVERKAWALLPRPDEAPEPPEDGESIFEGTPELYADAIAALRESHHERSRLFFRTAEADRGEYEVPLELGSLVTGDLARAFERLLRRAAPVSVENLAKPRPNLQETMRTMLSRLTTEGRPIEALFTFGFDRAEAVVGFLALLELVRLGQVALALGGDTVLFALASRSSSPLSSHPLSS